MKFKGHRHGKELMKILHPEIFEEIITILKNLEPYSHGSEKGKTIKDYIQNEFTRFGWKKEGKSDFNTDKSDFIDLCKWKVAIEMEYSRFEMFFRDFFRFMLLYESKEIDIAIIITYDEMAYERWGENVKSYKGARASLQKLIDFLNGDYGRIVRVPIWCIGIE